MGTVMVCWQNNAGSAELTRTAGSVELVSEALAVQSRRGVLAV